MSKYRVVLEERLAEYIAALQSALASTEFSVARNVYRERLDSARNILARWRGGESEASLKAALQVELYLFRAVGLCGREAESVSRAFGLVCRALGVIV
jgi:hypothetical protein